MIRRRPLGRALRIQRTLVRYGLDEVIDAVHFLRPARFLFAFAPRKVDRSTPLGQGEEVLAWATLDGDDGSCGERSPVVVTFGPERAAELQGL